MVPLLLGGFLALLAGASADAQRYAKYFGLLGSLGSSAMVAYSFAYQPLSSAYAVQWFSFLSYSFQLNISTSSINMLLLLLVSIVSPLIFWYSAGYMDVPSEQSRYYFELSIFAASMLLFAMSAGFLTLFIAWEGLGITSYLLIGFWYQRPEPAFAGRKAITTIIIGDIFLLAGILILWSSVHSFAFSSTESYFASLPAVPMVLYVGLAFILIAALTKSAQFPFHEWLSDAMEGPTPVSAFLHSSTMVKAGVFMVVLLLPLYQIAGMLDIILVIGIITAFIGALNAVSSLHLKKILAYSTIEDLGLMFVAIGMNALPAALLLFVVQTFYKALIFMSAGTIMKANDDVVDIYKTRSFGRSRGIFVIALVGSLSLAGIFPLSGFFGKVAVDAAGSSNMIIYTALTVLDFLTALYIFRWLFIPMKQQKANHTKSIDANYASISKNIIIPQVLLVIFVFLFSAFIFFYPAISPAASALPGMAAFSFINEAKIGYYDALVESAAAVAGVAAAVALFAIKANAFSEKSAVRRFLSVGFFVNAFYGYVAAGIMLISRSIGVFDFELNRLLYAGGSSTVGIGGALRKLENGSVNTYIIAFAIGLVLIIAMLVL
jgi:NADH-quinone oxidoreductase subunit L